MELVSVYLYSDYRSLFQYAKKLWGQNQIQATPEMAALIEKQGITRHMYKELKTVTIETLEEFYRNCLALLIYAIDYQSFGDISAVFDSESIIMAELEKEKSLLL
jgi:hypothetical protein